VEELRKAVKAAKQNPPAAMCALAEELFVEFFL
jgi:hypothetical protein